MSEFYHVRNDEKAKMKPHEPNIAEMCKIAVNFHGNLISKG